jgi:hypothetical protein
VGYSQARLNGRPSADRDSPARVISEEGGGDSLAESGRGRDNRDRARQMSQRDTTACGASAAPAWLRTNGDTDESRAPDAIDVHGSAPGARRNGIAGSRQCGDIYAPCGPTPFAYPSAGVAKLPA